MSAESNFSFTTKVNGDLLTVRGDTLDEFHGNLASVVANSQAIITDIGLLQAAGHATSAVVAAAPTPPPAAAPAAPGWGAPAAPAAPPAFAAAAVPACQHGPRTPRRGQSAKGPWAAWFCPTPKGTPGQCDAIWVDRKSPEWDAFPV